ELPPDGYVACPDCERPVVDALLAAHLRRHAGTDWFSQRRPVLAPVPGVGSRSRADTEGRGRARPRWRRARGSSYESSAAPCAATPATIPSPGGSTPNTWPRKARPRPPKGTVIKMAIESADYERARVRLMADPTVQAMAVGCANNDRADLTHP